MVTLERLMVELQDGRWDERLCDGTRFVPSSQLA